MHQILTWEDSQGGQQTLFVDIVGDHQDDHLAELSQSPLENGAPITDHIIKSPPTLTLQLGQVTKPFRDPAWLPTPTNLQARPVQTQLISPFLLTSQAIRDELRQGQRAGFTTLQNPNPGNRQQDVYQSLLDIFDNHYLCTILWDDRSYRGRVLTSLKKSRTVARRGTMVFDCVFSFPQFVSTQAAELPAPASLVHRPPAARGGKSKENVDANSAKGGRWQSFARLSVRGISG